MIPTTKNLDELKKEYESYSIDMLKNLTEEHKRIFDRTMSMFAEIKVAYQLEINLLGDVLAGKYVSPIKVKPIPTPAVYAYTTSGSAVTEGLSAIRTEM